jgi:hypothetical protein
MTAVVNGLAYTVSPGTERIVSVPAGSMNFIVPQVSAFPEMRTLAPNERLTLTLRPW